MIVPGMTPAEAANDARKDMVPLYNKVKPVFKSQERRHRTSRNRTDAFESLLQWRSPRGNNWIAVISTTKKETTIAAHVWYRGNDDRLRAIRVDLLRTAVDVYYSAHMLERYCERFDPSRDPIQRLNDFLFANHSVGMQYTKDLGEGKYEVLFGMLHGTCTGIADTQARLTTLTTFLDHGLLGADQQALSELTDIQRYFNYLSKGQRAHVMRGIEAELVKEEARNGAPVKDKDKVLAVMMQLAGLSPASSPAR